MNEETTDSHFDKRNIFVVIWEMGSFMDRSAYSWWWPLSLHNDEFNL